MIGQIFNFLFGFGRKHVPTIPSPQDNRDYTHYEKEPKVDGIDWNPRVGLIENQGNKPRCVGQGIEVKARVDTNRERGIDCYTENSGSRMADFEAEKFYRLVKMYDGYPGQAGTPPRAALKVLKKFGLIENRPQKGKVYTCDNYWRCDSFDEAMNDLFTIGPVLIVVKWYHSFFSSRDGVLIPKQNDSFFGYHAMSLTRRMAQDAAEGITRGINSYGPFWGKGGHFILPDNQWDNLVIEAWCFQ